MSKTKEFSCSGKITIHFRGVEKGRNIVVNNSSEVIDMMEQYFTKLLSTDSDFLTIDKLQIDQFSYDIKELD